MISFTKPFYLLNHSDQVRRSRLKYGLKLLVIGILVGFSLGYCYYGQQMDSADASMRAHYGRRGK